MPDHLFLSYSAVDGESFALGLADNLADGPPSIPVWMDRRRLRPGEDWDDQIVEAIRGCRALLFLVTFDSVQPHSVCKEEWVRALKYKKPVIPLLLQPDIELPFRLGSREYIDFTADFDSGLARLRKHLDWMGSFAGQLQQLKYRLQDAQRELQRARPEQAVRIKNDVAELEKQIAHQEGVIVNPAAAQQRVEERVEHGLERERAPAKPTKGVERHAKFVNPPPALPPSWFQNRHSETERTANFLKDDGVRLLTVVGRGGIGKSAMICRLLKFLEAGQLPDDLGPLPVDGIVYLSNARSSHPVTLPELYRGLSQLLPEETLQRIDAVYRNPKLRTREVMEHLLQAFSHGRAIVLLDNFEDSLDANAQVKSPELAEALRAFLELPFHGLKVIITTRVAPLDLLGIEPGRQRRLDLEKGLESPFAEDTLRAMDQDGVVGLRDAPEALLSQARERTRGNPRALEHLYGILSSDRDTTLPEILNDTKRLLPERVVEVLVGEAFNRLDVPAPLVMQSLAAFHYPVPSVAVDYLLKPYLAGVDSAPILKRLVNMQFARREAARYYLHPLDRDYALSRLPRGTARDKSAEPAVLTQLGFAHRAAEWFKETRKPREDWKNLDDLAPQLSEYELRVAAEEYDDAALVLIDISDQYLYMWGHFGLIIELHERVRGKMTDPVLEMNNADLLGAAHERTGHYQKAVACFERALSLSREDIRPDFEALALGGLGVTYAALGAHERSIEYHQAALRISRELKHRLDEATGLHNLSIGYSSSGDYQKAMEYAQEALAIAREIQPARYISYYAANLGNL